MPFSDEMRECSDCEEGVEFVRGLLVADPGWRLSVADAMGECVGRKGC